MANLFESEPMLDMFIFETSQLIEQLEQSILISEKESCYTEEAINEIFRIMHTLKGSAAMMMFDNISNLAHTMEDIFYYLREEKPQNVDCSSLSDLVLAGVDFIKAEVEKIKERKKVDGDATHLIQTLKDFLTSLKQNEQNTATQYTHSYKAVIYFAEGCGMETIRAFSVIHNLKDLTEEFRHIPEDLGDNPETEARIRQEGLTIYFKANHSYEMVHQFFQDTPFLQNLELIELDNDYQYQQLSDLSEIEVLEDFDDVSTGQVKSIRGNFDKLSSIGSGVQSMISVSVAKLDKLMDLVGEMVIAEAMVIQNPDLQGLELDNFHKSARQLNKITSEIQDMVMSIRMVSLSATFHKMHRVVRDMCKKLGKEVRLEIIGEETEVDKNIIEHISDPLMHLVRNAVDHGIESAEERAAKGKNSTGTIILEAKNAGSDVHIIVRDDGKGLNKEKILAKAKENGLLYKDPAEMTDKEIYNLIFLPGFSTKDKVSEFSGRGVGMDVVSRNLETIGGSVSVDSVADHGTTITLKIPLTLAIIDGMNVRVGNSRYTIPTISIKESFRPQESDIIRDPDGNEMIMVRGQCYSILRLHEFYKVKSGLKNFTEGIMVMLEQDQKTLCVFADELLGQQQVVVKALPEYVRRFKNIRGLAGCTLLGDGSISLILDVAGLINA